VLPELSATAATIAAVRTLLDARYDEDEDPALVLVGSRHLEVDGHRRNRAVTLIAASATQLHHDKLVPAARGTARRAVGRPGLGCASPGRGVAVPARPPMSQTH
jgi:hypothetical protein